MDFLFANYHISEAELKRCFLMANFDEAEIHALHEGDTASACLTRTPYFGLNPVIRDGEIHAVAGDPLLFDTPPKPETIAAVGQPHARTWQIAEAWRETGAGFCARFPPRHPGLMIRCNLATGRIELVTDQAGFVPAYVHTNALGAVIASSPDLIAALITPELDRVSALEKLGSGQVSYPFTLYEGITQLKPAAHVVIEGDRVETTDWWTPPEQEKTAPDPEARSTAIRTLLYGFLDRIAANLGTSGHIALSAGTDTRYLADGLVQHGVLDVTALCSTAVRNLESVNAEKVATALGLRYQHVPRPLDHHARCVLRPPYRLSTTAGWEHAHFFLNGLGNIWPSRFLLGGYMADAHLQNADLYHSKREKALQDQVLNDRAAEWAVSSTANAMSAQVHDEIADRRRASRAAFGFSQKHASQLAEIWPFASVLSNAHFGALSRNYPCYEFFMTTEVVNLAFRMSEGEKRPGLKAQLLAPLSPALRELPTNPSESQAVHKLFWQFKQAVPQELWPDHILHPGPWSEKRSAISDLVDERMEGARKDIEAAFDLEIAPDAPNRRRCYEIAAARRLSRSGRQ